MAVEQSERAGAPAEHSVSELSEGSGAASVEPSDGESGELGSSFNSAESHAASDNLDGAPAAGRDAAADADDSGEGAGATRAAGDAKGATSDDTPQAVSPAGVPLRPAAPRLRMIAAVLALAALALSGAGAMWLRAQGAYVYQRVTYGNLQLTVAASGPLQSATYDVVFAGSGKIARIAVRVGQHVNSGDVLAQLDATSLQDALNQAQAAVSAAQTTLDDAITNQQAVENETQAEVNAAYTQEQNAIYLCKHPSPKAPPPPPDCVQQAENQYNAAVARAATQNATAAAQVDAAQSQLNTAEARLQTAQDNLSNATLRAPHAGTVTAIYGTVGGPPGGAGGPLSADGRAIFAQIVDLSSLQVVAGIPEASIGRIKAGDAVDFTVAAYAGQLFHGAVSAVSPVGQAVASASTYPVTVDVDTSSLQGVNLLPGMVTHVTITTDQRFSVLLVSNRAVAYARRASESKQPLVTRVEVVAALAAARQLLTELQDSGTDVSQEDSTLAFVLERTGGRWIVRPVVLGLTDGTSCEVLAGLADGETVVAGTQ
jgi:multidrug efflux pump subunit AcrA (membrane-fusion protein)